MFGGMSGGRFGPSGNSPGEMGWYDGPSSGRSSSFGDFSSRQPGTISGGNSRPGSLRGFGSSDRYGGFGDFGSGQFGAFGERGSSQSSSIGDYSGNGFGAFGDKPK
ncbi:DEAD-box ATP-dependent RNA helicase 9-like [Gastrolobium bilobum]|uniref:DEAD-box ATP-dependent RNA helicase 9-like n=1 Tax=Gastrolobium bilobum TaxID=150636 RepID=UPI002AB032EC|nr:DEAD-box ATP-dependent RNA helicase 9-like [Gastrolobium bilobum]